jgi:trehalose-6-phosphate synthase
MKIFFWETYKEVNLLFAGKQQKLPIPDVVWIHDYQMMLAPRNVEGNIRGLSMVIFFTHSLSFVRIVPKSCQNGQNS